MSLLQDWRDVAYNQDGGMQKSAAEVLWADYFLVEKGIYESFHFTKKSEEL